MSINGDGNFGLVHWYYWLMGIDGMFLDDWFRHIYGMFLNDMFWRINMGLWYNSFWHIDGSRVGYWCTIMASTVCNCV